MNTDQDDEHTAARENIVFHKLTFKELKNAKYTHTQKINIHGGVAASIRA